MLLAVPPLPLLLPFSSLHQVAIPHPTPLSTNNKLLTSSPLLISTITRIPPSPIPYFSIILLSEETI